MTSIKELNLSPLTHTTLILNGIKSVEGLSRYTPEELENLKILDYFFDPNKTQKETRIYMVKEIETALYKKGIFLGSNDTKEVFDTEKRIKELNLPSVTIDRLKRNKVVTKGTLYTLEEKDLNRMYRIGKKTINDIKSVLPLENGRIKKLKIEEVAFKDLSEEEITLVQSNVQILNEQIRINRSKKREEEKQINEKKHRKDTLMSMKLSELYIPQPVFTDKILEATPNLKETKDFRLGEFLHFYREALINALEVENAISRLNIKGLHIRMTPKEYNDLEVTELDLKRVEEYKLDRHIEELKILEKIYEAKQINTSLKEEISTNKNLVELLQSLEEENERLRYTNNKYKAILDGYGTNESGQGQHRK